MAKQNVQKTGFFEGLKKWTRGVKLELKKVTWLTKKELVNQTLVVIGVSIVLASFVGAFDVLFSQMFFKWL